MATRLIVSYAEVVSHFMERCWNGEDDQPYSQAEMKKFFKGAIFYSTIPRKYVETLDTDFCPEFNQFDEESAKELHGWMREAIFALEKKGRAAFPDEGKKPSWKDLNKLLAANDLPKIPSGRIPYLDRKFGEQPQVDLAVRNAKLEDEYVVYW